MIYRGSVPDFKALFGESFVNRDRVFPVKAGQAKLFSGDVSGLYQVVDIQIGEAVQTNKIPDLIHRVLGRNQFTST